jgi:hypothetical protein
MEESMIIMVALAHPAQIHPQEQPSRTATPDSRPSSGDHPLTVMSSLPFKAFVISTKIPDTVDNVEA